jgi:NAD(P)-dependent dehydrogenase (short-subunit alcohol dehydrogenase family)
VTPTILVTGASRGIGAATAIWLGRHGCNVALVARNADALASTAEAVRAAGGGAVAIPADLARAGSAVDVVAAARDAFGPLDAVISNAGVIDPIEQLAAVEMEDWNNAIAVNLTAPAALASAALADLIERRGRFLALSSTAATNPIEGLSAYCAAKAGLRMMVRVLALETPDVTTLSIQPGPVDTDMHVSLRADAHAALAPEQAQLYRDFRADSVLRPPEVPGRSIAWLALAAPAAWSGQDVDHDDPRVVAGASELLGPFPKEQR